MTDQNGIRPCNACSYYARIQERVRDLEGHAQCLEEERDAAREERDYWSGMCRLADEEREAAETELNAAYDRAAEIADEHRSALIASEIRRLKYEEH
jgi:hypothetical protein